LASTADTAALSTKDKLIKSAASLFSANWYDAVSVAQICRHGGLSNGVFYRYFKDKEEIFKYILDGFLEIIEGRFKKIEGPDVERRLVSFFEFILESNRNDLEYISIFREGEFRFTDYEQRLRDIYLDALKRVYGREAALAEYLFIVGSIRFLLRRPCFSGDKVSAEYLKDLVYNGIFKNPGDIDFSCLDIDLPPALDDPEEADTRTKLILSGKQLIAENSFYEVNIYEITRNAGYAVGTFYLNFKTKEDLFREVVRYLGRQVRHYISVNLGRNLNRIEQEIQGWVLFLKYFETHVQNYEIVREAEFVVKDAALEYYNKFENGYINDETAVRIAERDIASNFLMGIAHFLGIEYFFSKNIKDVRKVIMDISGPLCEGLKK
jgi:AcrR family transcriptional regulator